MDDLISRQAAIDALMGKMKPHNNMDGTMTIHVMSEELVRETLNNLPSAQSEHGRWEEREVIDEIESSDAIGEWQSARCSVCGRYHTTPYMYCFTDYEYCPWCGAYMKGEQDEQTD